MLKKQVRSVEEILELIELIKSSQNITMMQIEKECGIGTGTISRWKNATPRINNVLKVLDFLNVTIVLYTEKLDACESGESTNAIAEENLDIDTALVILLMKILKSNTLSDKEKLYKILQAFA